MRQTLTAYVGVITKGTPQTLKLPLFEYGVKGRFRIFVFPCLLWDISIVKSLFTNELYHSRYSQIGAYEYFNAHLRPLATYPALRSEVYQMFREVGNTVIVIKAFEDILVRKKNEEYFCIISFLFLSWRTDGVFFLIFWFSLLIVYFSTDARANFYPNSSWTIGTS